MGMTASYSNNHVLTIGTQKSPKRLMRLAVQAGGDRDSTMVHVRITSKAAALACE